MSTPKLISETADFRVYAPEERGWENGKRVVLQLCEELVEGRWEPFFSVRKVTA